MRFEPNPKNSQRDDYEEFSKFLGLNSRQCSRRSVQAMSPSVQDQACRSSKPLAMVYAEKQEFCGIYDPEIALINGTVFEELNLPFYKSKCSKNGGCNR